MVPHYTPLNNQTQAVHTCLSIPNNQPRSLGTNYPSNNQSNNPRPTRPASPLVEPIPVSYTELLSRLIQSQLVAHVPLIPIEPPYPRWYDANASCDYHYEIKSHSTKNCQALKNQVQAFKNIGYVNFGFNKAGGLNVVRNPLPNHFGPKINAILEGTIEGRKTCVNGIITPMKVIYKELIQARLLQSKRGGVIEKERLSKGYYQYQAILGHVIQECTEFRNIVQSLMDRKEIEFSELIHLSINVITGTTYSGTPSSVGPKPITIFHDNEAARVEVPKVSILVLMVEVPRPFPYES